MKYLLITIVAISFIQTSCLGDAETNLPVGVVVPMPPFTNDNSAIAAQSWRQAGIELMQLKNVDDGDENSFYPQWIAPTSIVVNAFSYNVSTGICSSFSVSSVITAMPFSVEGFLIEKENEKEARIAAFAEIAGSSSFTTDIIASRYSINQFGNNLLRIASVEPQTGEEIYQSKNIYVRINAPTNALDFAVAIINAGLPENERIAVTPEGE